MDKNILSRLKNVEHWKREGMNTVYVGVGLIGATLLDRLVQKAADKWFPSIAPYVSYVKAGSQFLGGLTLSVLSDVNTSEGKRMSLIGYGISGAGLISGLRLIPAIDKLMSDPISGLGSVERLLGLNLGDFGNIENIKKISTSEAQETPLELPDLGYTETEYSSDSSSAEVDGETVEVFAEVI
jgi:hypothetical protein